MSLPLSVAAIRTYDLLKTRPGARPRHSDARDKAVLGAIDTRLRELLASYTIGLHEGQGGKPYVFWTEVEREVRRGAFDDLLTQL